VVTFTDISQALPRPTTAQLQIDSQAQASYSYDAASRTMISYDTPDVAAQKVAYIQQRGLGGGMWWESSADKPQGQGSLIELTVKGLGGLQVKANVLSYPESKYDNLRAGMP
jgi:chitinase